MSRATFFLLHIVVLAAVILLIGTGLALLTGYEMRRQAR